jgi:hypothetical protein
MKWYKFVRRFEFIIIIECFCCQVLSSTIIRGMLASGSIPEPRALHTAVAELIQERGLYGCPPTAAPAGATASVPSTVPASSSTKPSSSSAPVPPWGPNSKAARALGAPTGGGPAPKAGGNSPKATAPKAEGNSPKAAASKAESGSQKSVASKAEGGAPRAVAETRSVEAIAAEINDELMQAPLARRCHVIVLFGTHGTGKGTVAQALCSAHQYTHVSFGKCS